MIGLLDSRKKINKDVNMFYKIIIMNFRMKKKCQFASKYEPRLYNIKFLSMVNLYMAINLSLPNDLVKQFCLEGNLIKKK